MVGKEEGRVGQIYNRLRIQSERRRVRWLEPPNSATLWFRRSDVQTLRRSDVQTFRRSDGEYWENCPLKLMGFPGRGPELGNSR